MRERKAIIAALMAGLLGCAEEPERVEDPPLAVPGTEVTDPPPIAIGAMGTMEPPSFDPPLAVPGQPSPIPPPPPPALPAGQLPPGMQPGQAPAGVEPGQPPPADAPGPIALAPGFVPDPAIVRGMGGGQVPARSLDPSCDGHVPSEPSHVLNLSDAFETFRVLVASEADTVLVIRRPDGSFLCNDDAVAGETPNPAIEGSFGPGAYTIWVGSYAPVEQPVPYAIGFTEQAEVTHANLGS